MERESITTIYYCWERELSLVNATPKLPKSTYVEFAELPVLKLHCQNVTEASVTLHIGDVSLDLRQELTPDLLKALVEVLRSC
jgi:hypothetical protein